MIYSYKPHKITGANGTTITHRNTEDNDITTLGEIGGVVYLHIPDGVQLPEQPPEIALTEVTLTSEQKQELRHQSVAILKRNELRTSIDTDVGDVQDLLADCMKLIEMNIMLTSRLAADYFGTTVLDKATKDLYAQRNQTFLDSVDNGHLLIRGAIEDVTEMQSRLMTRYSKINHLVKDKYIDELSKMGL